MIIISTVFITLWIFLHALLVDTLFLQLTAEIVHIQTNLPVSKECSIGAIKFYSLSVKLNSSIVVTFIKLFIP